LKQGGVETLIHYPTAPHLQGAYLNQGYPQGMFPLAEQLADEVISLPMGPHLHADAVEIVASIIHNYCADHHKFA
jgi:dTDP-4-amino-4,6-dideoxygalactose transaminase